MYSFLFDTETGGIILTDKALDRREPRPVYSLEMDYLGFDKHFEYDKQTDTPYLWYVNSRYYYRGVKIATIRGGDYFNAPNLIVENLLYPSLGGELLPMDIPGMIEKNRRRIDDFTAFSCEKLEQVWNEYKNQVDLFKVAFSGGKDSEAALAVARAVLPNDGYIIVFGDTGMEFPDTYKVVDQVKADCEQEGIRFYIAKSKFDALDTWKRFGPPSRQLRWCHRVHKTVPTTLLTRSIVGKNVSTFVDIVGVRRNESLRRSTYEYFSYSKQQKGQYSFYPILEWTSAEVWLKIFCDGLPINNAYKHGHSRAGCVCCPMSRGRHNHLRQVSYPDEFNSYMDVVRLYYGKQDDSFFNKVCWGNRRSADICPIVKNQCTQELKDGVLSIHIIKPTSNWREWMKTIGPLKRINGGGWVVSYNGKEYEFSIVKSGDAYDIKTITPVKIGGFTKLFRQVFGKAAYCVGCQACEVNCVKGNLKFTGGQPKITGDCSGCRNCHEYVAGCLRRQSLCIHKKPNIPAIDKV